MGKRRFLKQIKSFEKLIHKHKEKIEKEKIKPVPDVNLIRYWEKEIQVFMDEIVKAKKRIVPAKLFQKNSPTRKIFQKRLPK